MKRLSILVASLFLAGAPTIRAADNPAASPSAHGPHITPGNRIASIFISQTLINDLLKQNMKSKLLQDVRIELVPSQSTGTIILHGTVKVPVEELKAINLDKGAGDFKFQVELQLKTTRKGHLILIFPLNETYFWPANSDDPVKDRVIVPVQMLSIALASARGYLAALSGDFSGFDRKTVQLKVQIKELDRELPGIKDPDLKEAAKNERKSAQLQLEAIPVEREQIAQLAKTLQKVIGFSGEKELNGELAAHRNALVLKIPLSQLAPYLEGVELGGIRILQNKRYGTDERYFAIDIDAQLDKYEPPLVSSKTASKPEDHRPDVMIRLNQSLFESEAIVSAEAKDVDKKVQGFGMSIQEDGFHVHGKYRLPLVPNLPFGAVLKFVWMEPNVFELRVEKIKIAHVSVKPLAGEVLNVATARLNRSLKGACSFKYIGKEEDGSRAVRVTLDMAKLLPAFPDMTLTNIVTKDKELVLKAAKL